MEKKNGFLGFYIIGSAIIWGAAILGCAFLLKGTGNHQVITAVLGPAAAIHLILIWGPLAARLKKMREED